MYEELNDDLDEVSGIFNAESEILGRLGNRPMGYGEGTLILDIISGFLCVLGIRVTRGGSCFGKHWWLAYLNLQ